MAFNPAPNTWFENWSEDGSDITVPIATFPEMTAAEADGDTGDIRKVWYAMVAKMYADWLSLATADRPVKMTMTRSSSLVGDNLTLVFNFTFYNTVTGQEVLNEAPTPTPTPSPTPTP
jgi:hypothetical protein